MYSKALPKISIVTPSFNQASLLEDTIISVLSQGYPNLEYIIIDGGSTDGSVDIIKKYADRLVYWVSEPDEGRGDAVNKGFKHSTGEIMAWMGCGDQYCAWAFVTVSDIFNALPGVSWIASSAKITLDIKGLPCSRDVFDSFSILGSIPLESTFWRRSVWERAGGYIDKTAGNASEIELWNRFCRFSRLLAVSVPLGIAHKYNKPVRNYPGNKYKLVCYLTDKNWQISHSSFLRIVLKELKIILNLIKTSF